MFYMHGMHLFESGIGYMIEITLEQRKQVEEMYNDMCKGGIILGRDNAYYVVDGQPVEAESEWNRRIKLLFGEDSELTNHYTRKRETGFITQLSSNGSGHMFPKHGISVRLWLAVQK